MGIPGIQLFLIFARQMAKPVSNGLMNYGKKHQFIRNRILIPTGRGIANFTTRLRMRDLGLGKPAVLVKISDEAALGQASDILQEIVLYLYGIGIFTFYYYYTKKHEKEIVSPDELEEFAKKIDEKLDRLQQEIQELRNERAQKTLNNEQSSINGSSSSWFGQSKSQQEDQSAMATQPPSTPTIPLSSNGERVPRPRRNSSSSSTSANNTDMSCIEE